MSGERSEPGLVPFKTSPPTLISFDRLSVHDRRIARMRRAVWGSAHWLQRGARSKARCWFVTLTYRPGREWASWHVSGYIEALRKWCKKREATFRYVWVAELQGRGAMHYHVAVWLPSGLSLPLPDKSRMWDHGMSNRAIAIAPIGYLMKYVSKGDTPMHHFPKGARIYGTGGLCADGRATRQWLNLPEWAKRVHGVGELQRFQGRLVVRGTGEVLDSPWRVKHVPGGLLLQLTRELPPRFADGPFSTMRLAA